MLKIPDDLHEWLVKVQSGFRFKYNKTISQLQILLHLPHNEVKSEDYDKAIDKLYESITKHPDNQHEMRDKKRTILISDEWK